MGNLKRIVLFHFHIFKNAGTTIDWILKKNFSKSHVTLDDETNPGAILSWEKIFDYIKKKKNVQSFSSHQARFPIPENTDFEFIPMVFIRHPIDRAFSIYSFKRKSLDKSIGTVKARSMTVTEFIQWNLDLKGYMPMKNFQTQYLSDKNTKSEVNVDDYELAIKRIKNCKILGVVDRLNESLVLAEECARKFFKNIDFSYIIQNVSADRKDDLSQRLVEGRSQSGEDLWLKLNEHNKLDLQLYSVANEDLDRRLNEIDNFEQKLSDFLSRCKHLKK